MNIILFHKLHFFVFIIHFSKLFFLKYFRTLLSGKYFLWCYLYKPENKHFQFNSNVFVKHFSQSICFPEIFHRPLSTDLIKKKNSKKLFYMLYIKYATLAVNILVLFSFDLLGLIICCN